MTNESINNKRSDFMRVLNSSYRKGCLQCSFSDKEMNEFIQYKKRNSSIDRKKAVQMIGMQDDGTWTLGEGLHVSEDGQNISESECKTSWISNMYQGRGIPHPSKACIISTPYSTQCLETYLALLKKHTEHNFLPSVLIMSATAMVLHYQEFIAKLNFCPIPIGYGASGTGKTTALDSGMALVGAQDSRLYSKITKEMMFDLCCNSSGIPLGVDDPHSKSDISKLLVELYNGKKGASIGRGEKVPKSTVIITANFSPTDQTRFYKL